MPDNVDAGPLSPFGPVDGAPATDPPAVAPSTVADGQERQLDPSSVTVARIGTAITLAIFGVLGLVGGIVGTLALELYPGTELLLALGLLLAYLLFAGLSLYMPGVRYRYASYRVDERGIEIRRGVFWRSVTTVPKSRVQHTDVTQGPIDRSFGLSTLVIHTAGTQDAVVTLGGLAHAVALSIRDYLIEGGEGRDDAV